MLAFHSMENETDEGKMFQVVAMSRASSQSLLAISIAFLFAAVVLSGCTRHTHEKLDGVLWMQTSPEYQMAAKQTYNLAQYQLDRSLMDPSWTAALEQNENYNNLPPAIILDIDETVMDNSRFQGQLVKDDTDFLLDLWTEWVEKAQASAIPGALDFANYAVSRNVQIFYVTNRHHDSYKRTRDNLQALQFPYASNPDHVLSKHESPDWGSDKSSRRQYLAERFRIVLIVGDDLNDFVSGAKGKSVTPEERVILARKYSEFWGKKWIILPNPLYGSWQQSIYSFDFTLTDSQVLQKKHLNVKGFRQY